MIFKLDYEYKDYTSKKNLVHFLHEKNIPLQETGKSYKENLINTFVDSLHFNLVKELLCFFDVSCHHKTKKEDTYKRYLKETMTKLYHDGVEDDVKDDDDDVINKNTTLPTQEIFEIHDSDSESDNEQKNNSSSNTNKLITPEIVESSKLNGSFYQQKNIPIMNNLNSEFKITTCGNTANTMVSSYTDHVETMTNFIQDVNEQNQIPGTDNFGARQLEFTNETFEVHPSEDSVTHNNSPFETYGSNINKNRNLESSSSNFKSTSSDENTSIVSNDTNSKHFGKQNDVLIPPFKTSASLLAANNKVSQATTNTNPVENNQDNLDGKKRSLFPSLSDFKKKARKLNSSNLVLEINRSPVIRMNNKFQYIVMFIIKEEGTGQILWCFDGKMFESFFSLMGESMKEPLLQGFRKHIKRLNIFTDEALKYRNKFYKYFISRIMTHVGDESSMEEEFKNFVEKLESILKDKQFFEFYKEILQNNYEDSTKGDNYMKTLISQYIDGKGFALLPTAVTDIKYDVSLNNFFLNQEIVNHMVYMYNDNNLQFRNWSAEEVKVAGCNNPKTTSTTNNTLKK